MATLRGGEKFERAMARLAVEFTSPYALRVGFLENAKYPDGTPVAMIAAIQDYGAPRANIPPRPFFRNMIKSKSPLWAPALAANLRATNNNVRISLERVGQGIVGQLKQSIIETNAPPLAPRTIARKGFSKPLIETSHMINSADYEVRR